MCDSTSTLPNVKDSSEVHANTNATHQKQNQQHLDDSCQAEITSTDNGPGGDSKTKSPGQKRTADDVNVTQVHSANAWEKADMGDDGRKMKFLKLMGAGKKNHSGKIVIGDSNKPKEDSAEGTKKTLNEELEQQFSQGLEHKLMGVRRHRGLGFHNDDNKAPVEENQADAVITRDEELNIVASAAARSESTENQETTTKESQPDGQEDKNSTPSESKKKPTMGFVKSSS